MSEIKRLEVKSGCKSCSNKQIIFQLGFALDKSHIQIFTDNGYILSKSYIDKGILYIENADISATGPFGSNRLQIRCKISSCNLETDKLENILKTIV